MEILVKPKKWGSSLGIIIPKEIVDAKNLSSEKELIIEIKEPVLVSDIMGLLKGKIKKSTQQIKDEMREGWKSNSDIEREKIWEKKK